ncbi:MAG: DUF6884 domain-containing protein, partial [Tepidisphaeraceae bacterium]
SDTSPGSGNHKPSTEGDKRSGDWPTTTTCQPRLLKASSGAGEMSRVARIVLISCVKSKRTHPTKARLLYTSDLFEKSLAYARSLNADAIYILSAKHGLLEMEAEVAPYNETLKTMKSAAVKAWAERVLSQLGRVTDLKSDSFVLLAGQGYRRYLLPHLKNHEIPMEGLGIGQQLQFLKKKLHERAVP